MASSGTYVVYRITNLVDGKFYIGAASGGLAKRRREHLCVARRGKSRLKLYRAMVKHGIEQFEFAVIEECSTFDEVLRREIELIASMKPHYNLTRGGQGVVGAVRSPETRERMRQASTGKPGYWLGKKRPDISAGARDRLLAKPLKHWLGKKRSAETRAKISLTKRMKAASAVGVSP